MERLVASVDTPEVPVLVFACEEDGRVVNCADVHARAVELRRAGCSFEEVVDEVIEFVRADGEIAETIEEVFRLQLRVCRSLERQEAKLDDLFAFEQAPGFGPSSVLRSCETGWLPTRGWPVG